MELQLGQGALTRYQCMVLDSVPHDTHPGIFVNVSETRAENALIARGGLTASQAKAVLLALVEEGLLVVKQQRSYSNCFQYRYFFKAFDRSEFPDDYSFVLARCKHFCGLTKMEESLLKERGWELTRRSYMAIDWADRRYAAFLRDNPHDRCRREVVELLGEWGGVGCGPFLQPCHRRLTKTSYRHILKIDKSALDLFLRAAGDEVRIDAKGPPVRSVEFTHQVEFEGAEEEEDGRIPIDEQDYQQKPEDWAASAPLCDDASRLQRSVSNATGETEVSVFSPEHAECEQHWMCEAMFTYVPLTDTPPYSNNSSPIVAESHQRCGSVRWGIRSVVGSMFHHRNATSGLCLLAAVNNERMSMNLCHPTTPSFLLSRHQCDRTLVQSFLGSVPLASMFLLHEKLSELRIHMEKIRGGAWYRQRIEEDVNSCGRLLRVDLWELRYPGWLIVDILARLGSTLLTVELEAVLEEVVVAAFPALKHVPDTIRADVLVSFGRTSTIDQLLMMMLRLIPIYTRRGGRLLASPSAMICPTFMTSEEFVRPVLRWGQEQWAPLRLKWIEARNGAARRMLEVEGNGPSAAPW